MAIPYVVDAAHLLVERAVEPGDLVVDATVGNGHDALFLAQAVGPEGRVIGFDVQEEALKETRRRVEDRAPGASLDLIHDGHEAMATHLAESVFETVGAVMFNLGYLPGGDHSITTTTDTTISAVDTSIDLLRPGGVLTIVAYTGHEGGKEEARAVKSWLSSLSDDRYRGLSYRFINQRNDPPRLYAVEKREL